MQPAGRARTARPERPAEKETETSLASGPTMGLGRRASGARSVTDHASWAIDARRGDLATHPPRRSSEELRAVDASLAGRALKSGAGRSFGQTHVRIDHSYELRRGETLLAEASTTIACVDRSGQLRQIPEFLQ